MVKFFDSIKGRISNKQKASHTFSSDKEIAGTYKPKESLEDKNQTNDQNQNDEEKNKKKFKFISFNLSIN